MSAGSGSAAAGLSRDMDIDRTDGLFEQLLGRNLQAATGRLVLLVAGTALIGAAVAWLVTG